MSTHGERLKQFVDIAFTTRREFAEKLGMEENSLGKYLGSGKKSLFGEDYRAKLSELGLNIGWYVSGEGDMTVSKNANYNNESNTNVVSEDIIPYNIKIHEPTVLNAGEIKIGRASCRERV